VSSVSDAIADLAARRGLDPGVDIPPEPPFDPVEWRTATYTAILDREIPKTFAGAAVTDPAILRWATGHLADPAGAPWLLLTGNTGVGKTHQAYGVLRLLVLGAAQANRRCRWRFVTHPEMNAELRPKPDDSHTSALGVYLEADLLVLDDVGAGKSTDWTLDSLIRLVDHRWSHRMPTIYTTNLDADQLGQTVGDRVLSRLADGTVVALSGRDRRWMRGPS